MADEREFHAAVITPEGVVTELEVNAVKFPAHDGLTGILTHRAPLLTKLGVGTLTLAAADGEKRYFIAGGYAQMQGNKLTILPDEAIAAQAITPALIEKEKAKLQEVAGMQTSDMGRRQKLAARVQGMEALLGGRA